MSRAALSPVAAVIAMSLLAAGCAAPRASDASLPEAMTRFEILGEIASEDAAPRVISASELCPLQPGARVFIHAKDPERMLRIVTTATTEFGAEVAVKFGDTRTEYWRAEDDGGVTMPAVIDHDDDALSLFDPALLIAPVEIIMFSGVPEATAAMRVVDSNRRDREKERGEARRSLTRHTDQRIRTPLGACDAIQVTAHFTADLRFAEANTWTTWWIDHEQQRVSRRVSRRGDHPHSRLRLLHHRRHVGAGRIGMTIRLTRAARRRAGRPPRPRRRGRAHRSFPPGRAGRASRADR